MDTKNFIEKYDGKTIDYDGYYGGQCMDLMHFFVDYLIGKPSPDVLRAANARLAYLNFNRYDLFDKIDNTLEGVPQEGDIMFWGGGEYGHVAIFIEGNVNEFTSFDQNYPLGSPCHKQYHNYYNVLGWLRFKGGSMSCEDELIEMRASRDKWKNKCGEWEVKYTSDMRDKQEHIESLQKSQADMNLQLTNITQSNKILSEQKNALEGKLEALEEDFKGYAEDSEQHISDMQIQISKLNTKLGELKDKLNKKLFSYSWWERLFSLFRRGGDTK